MLRVVAAPRVSSALGLAVFLSSASALADKVVVLPFSGASATAKSELAEARGATQSAVLKMGHTGPTPSEMLTAEMAVKDGVADTSEEFRAAGRASSSAWAVSGRVEPHGLRYRLELEVCQVKSGRVESLAREIDSDKAPQQIGEMLTLLVRPDGIGNADIPWERETPPLPPATPPSGPPPTAPPAQPPQVTVQPPLLQPPPEKTVPYGEGRPFSVGAGLNVLSAFVRPSEARGNPTALFLSGALGYAIDAVPGLELRADFGGAVAGPKALILEGGARYARVLEPRLRIYAGPEVELGAFFTINGDTTPRFFARGSAFGGIGITEQVAVELTGDLAVAPGGAGTLVFGGGGARGVVRF